MSSFIFFNKKALLIIYTFLILFIAKAQKTEGTLMIYQDHRIDSLVELNVAYNKSFPFISGYRIQIFMGSGNDALDNAGKIKQEFEVNFPDVKAYITFREPYYRVRVGDYRNRLEANQLLEAIRKIYPDAWIIQENITLPLLSTYQKTESYE